MLAALCVKNMRKSRLRLRQIGAFERVAERREVRGVRRCALGLHMPEKMNLLLIIEAILQCAVCLRKRVLQLAQRPAVFAHTEIQRLSQQLSCRGNTVEAEAAKLRVGAVRKHHIQLMPPLRAEIQLLRRKQTVKQLFQSCPKHGRRVHGLRAAQIRDCDGVAGGGQPKGCRLLTDLRLMVQRTAQDCAEHGRNAASNIHMEQPLLIQLLLASFDSGNDVIHISRFCNVVADAVLDRLLRVGKIRKGGQQNDLDLPLCAADPPRKLQPVHDRHFDVGDDNVRLIVEHGLLCLQTVFGSADDLTAELCPVNQCAKALAHQRLVVRDQNFVHVDCPPLEAGL